MMSSVIELQRYCPITGGELLGTDNTKLLRKIVRPERTKIYKAWKANGYWFKVKRRTSCYVYELIEEVNAPDPRPMWVWDLEQTRYRVRMYLKEAQTNRIMGNIETARNYERILDTIYQETTDPKTREMIEELELET